jgi:hypothetical protein
MVWTRRTGAAPAAAVPTTPADPGAPPPPVAATPPPAAAAPPPAAAAPPPPAAAATPPLQTYQPPAEAAAPTQPAAPVTRRPRRTAAAAPAAAAPPAQPAAAVPPPAQPAAAAAPPAQPAAQTTAVSVPSAAGIAALYAPGGALASIFGPPKVNGLAAIVGAALARGEPNLFPTVFVTSGATGGQFDVDAMNPEGSDDDLPTGRKGFHAVLFGWRMFVNVWPQAASDNGSGEAPKWKGSIGHLDGDLQGLAMEAFKKYQMSKGAGKERLNQVFGPYGHPQMAIEMLVCDHKAGLMVVRGCATYQSVVETANQLSALYSGDGKDGTIYAEGVRFDTQSEKVNSKGREWTEHWPTLRVDRDHADAQASAAVFAQILSGEGREEVMADIAKWASTSLTDAQLDDLHAITQQDTRS